ncbi:MAG: type II toxin-antitoxin system RelE/ParE family toxin [Chloroflexi bacterium]|nr:type II toxin-antitoxin system RelE/ParE family toxin [Chloroflexota bacterium]
MLGIVWQRAAWREFERLGLDVQARVEAAVDGLALNPRPPAATPLRVGGLRLRVGHYRVVYDIDESAGRIIVRAIGHRRDIYERL